MMLPATVNSCLKYIHTNFSINIGTGTWYIEQLNDLYPKTSAGNTRPIAASNSFVAQTRRYDINVPPSTIAKVLTTLRDDDVGTFLPKTLFNINEKCRSLIDVANGILPTCSDAEKTMILLQMYDVSWGDCANSVLVPFCTTNSFCSICTMNSC